VGTLGATFGEGQVILPDRVSRYVAQIIQVDTPEVPEVPAV
jgi:hypothetical protein